MIEKQKQIFQLDPGQNFGEIALLQEDCMRTCTIKASEDKTILVKLEKQDFLMYMGRFNTKSVRMIFDFFETCKFFEGIPVEKLQLLAPKSFIMRFPPNTIIVKQGDTPFNIYFVAKGTVRAVRRLQLDSRSHENERKQIEPPEGSLVQLDVLGRFG